MASRPEVAATARRIMHGAMEDADVEAMKRQLARELDLLIGKFKAVGLVNDGMTMFTAAAAQMMAASASPPNDND